MWHAWLTVKLGKPPINRVRAEVVDGTLAQATSQDQEVPKQRHQLLKPTFPSSGEREMERYERERSWAASNSSLFEE